MSSRGGLLCLLLLASGCAQPTAAPSAARLAANQELRLVSRTDVQTLDPAKVHQPSVEVGVVRNVFGGLYRFDNGLTEREDLAAGPPQVSADGLTWTFHLRRDAAFSNGDPVRATDVLYSWNRLAALTDTDYGSAVILENVVGYAELQAKRSQALAGLTAPDDHTVVAHLNAAAGWWQVKLGLWAAAVVDERVVRRLGEESWWRTPEGLIGTGPYRMSSRSPGSLEFVPVPHWWRGSTGNLRKVRIDLVADEQAELRGYAANLYDVAGYLPTSTAPAFSDTGIQSYLGKPDLRTRPWLRTTILGFPSGGHLGSDPDPRGRQGLSQALDRAKLASVVCSHDTICAPATGGLIPKGLAGYLGDARDPNTKFSAGGSRTLLDGWDPDGSRRKELRMGVPIFQRRLAESVLAQWHDTLGLDVRVQYADGPTIRLNTRRGNYDITIAGFLADYDSPRNWLHDAVSEPFCTYQKPEFINLRSTADAKLPNEALPLYQRAGQLLANDAACPALLYLKGVFLIKPWVRGAGGNALYEFDWMGISILEHTA